MSARNKAILVAIVALFTTLPVTSANNKPVALANEWELLGEAINEPGWDIWGSSPIITKDGKVHLFVARWPSNKPFASSWHTHSEIARYAADSPEGPFKFQETILKSDGEGWNAKGYHNPNIQKVGKKFVLSCIAHNNKKMGKRLNASVGIYIADKIEGPWKPANGDPNKPAVTSPTDKNSWLYNNTTGITNPALLKMKDGTIHLYFKVKLKSKKMTGTFMGVAMAKSLAGPFEFYDKPVTENKQHIEDGYAFHWRGKVCFLTTDNSGIIEKGGGLLWTSKDGKSFGSPLHAFHKLDKGYLPDGVPSTAKSRYTGNVKCERLQILVIKGEPAYLYAPSGVALDGSDGTNSYVFRRKMKKVINN